MSARGQKLFLILALSPPFLSGPPYFVKKTTFKHALHRQHPAASHPARAQRPEGACDCAQGVVATTVRAPLISLAAPACYGGRTRRRLAIYAAASNSVARSRAAPPPQARAVVRAEYASRARGVGVGGRGRRGRSVTSGDDAEQKDGAARPAIAPFRPPHSHDPQLNASSTKTPLSLSSSPLSLRSRQ